MRYITRGDGTYAYRLTGIAHIIDTGTPSGLMHAMNTGKTVVTHGLAFRFMS